MENIFPKTLTIRQAVIATLAYFDLFEIPLTRNEISEYLFFSEPDEEKIDLYLRESPAINFYDGYYSLGHYPIFFQNFFEKQTRSQNYWKKIKRYQWLLSICPFIELIAVCNSLTIRNIHEDSDIDLFVVVKKNHLFTARFFLTLFTSIFGVRRHGNKIRKRFCLSFYASETELDFSKIAKQPFDIYLAYWIKTLDPIVGDYGTYMGILEKNSPWLQPYFKNMVPRKRYFRARKNWQKRLKSWLEKKFEDKKWEEKFKTSQLERIHQKLTLQVDQSGTIVTENMLKFHDHDIREEIKNKWMERVNSLL